MSNTSEKATETRGANFISTPVVLRRTCLSRSTLHRSVNAGEFPKPVRIGKQRVAYVEAEVDKWINDRIALRDDPTAAHLKRERSLRALEGKS